jgi:cytoskeletal protein CcmA (bactofilin family)
MFSKKYDKVETIIGEKSTVRGEVEIKGTLRVDGKIEGNIRSDWVVIGPKGVVKGDILASGVAVGGVIEGNINSKEAVEIKNKGRVSGDITTPKLVIMEGGIFDGHSMMNQKSDKILELPGKTEALAE